MNIVSGRAEAEQYPFKKFLKSVIISYRKLYNEDDYF